MVGNIGKFTAAGQGLEDSVTAMEGIANWAAMSGQNAQAASHAMYQLSQAMGAGVMRKEDYKSIQNVSMDTVEFRQHALDAAVALGTLKKTGEDTYKSLVAGKKEFTIDQFAEHLTQDAWFTSDVMMAVFKDYSAAVDQIYEYSEEKGITASEAMEELGGQVDEFGMKAFKSAQQARTLQDAIGSIQDAASTTWMNIFETIFGNADEATSLWTAVANEGYDIFVEPLNTLHEIVQEAFGGETPTLTKDMWQNLGLTAEQAGALAKRLMEVGKSGDKAFEGKSVDEFIDSLDEGNITIEQLNEALAGTENSTVSNLEDIRKKALEVIKGNYTNDMAKRFQMLTEEGYDAQKVQDYVNVLKKLTNGTWEFSDAIFAEADASFGAAEEYASLTDEQLKAAGWTPGQIQALRELEEQAKKTGTPLNELVKTMSDTGKTGRQTFFDALRRSAMGIGIVFEELKAAFGSVFSVDGVGFITDFISGFDKLSLSVLRFTKQNAGRFKATFTGVFSVFDLGLRVVKAFADTGLNVLGHVFDGIGGKALRFTAKIGNGLKTFHDWVVQNELIEKSIGAIGDAAISGIDKVKGWFDTFLQIPIIQANLSNFKTAFKTVFDNLVTNIGNGTDAFDILFDSIAGNITGLREGKVSFGEAFKNITDTVKLSVRKLIGDDGIKSLDNAFKALKASFGDFVSNLGKNKDGTLNAFGKLQKVFGTARESVKALFGDMKTHLTDLVSGKIDFKQFFENLRTSFQNGLSTIADMGGVKSLQEVFSNLKTSISTFFDNLGKNEDGSLNKFGKLKEFFGNTGVAIGQFFDKVRTNVSDLSSGKIDLKAFFVNLKEDFEKGVESLSLSDGLDAIKKKFEEARTSVVNFLDDLGTNEDGTANAFGKLWNGIKNTFGKAVTKISAAKTAIGDFFNKLDIVGIATRNFGNLKTAFTDFFTNLPSILGGVKDKFKEFIARVTELGDFKFENLPKIFEAFGDTVGEYFENLDLFAGIKEAFAKLWEDLGANLDETGIGPKIAEIFDNLKTKIKESLASVGIDVDAIRDKIVGFFESIKAAWDQYNPIALFEKLKAFLEGKGFSFGQGSEHGLSFSLTELITKLKGLIKLAPFISAVGRVLTGLAALKGVKLLKKEIQPTNFLDMAKSIGILAASISALVLVSKDSPDQLVKAAGVLGAITAGFAAISALVSTKLFDPKKIETFANAMSGMCKGLLEVILALYLINNFKPGDNLVPNMKIILEVLSVMALISAATSWFTKKDTKVTGIAELADAMIKLVGIMIVLDNYKIKDMDNLVENYRTLLLGIAGLLAVFRFVGGDYKGIGDTVKSLSTALLMCAGAVLMLSSISASGIDRALSAIEQLSLCLGALMVLGKGSNIGSIAGIWSLTAVIAAIAISINTLAKLDSGALDNATESINKVIGVLTLLSGVLGFSGLTINPGTAIAIIGVLAILGGIVAALVVLQDEKLVNPDNVIALAEKLTEIMNALTKAVAVMGIFGGLAAGGIVKLAAVAGVIAAIATVIGALKEVGEDKGWDFSGIADKFHSGIDTLIEIANEIGRVVGSFIDGILTEAAGTLPGIVADVKSFFDTMKELNDLPDLSNAFSNLSKAAGVVGEFGVEGFKLALENALPQWLGMDDVITQMKDAMKNIAEGFKDFATILSECNGIKYDTSGLEEAINMVKDAYKGGWNRTLLNKLTEMWFGKTLIEQMTDDMEELAEGFNAFATSMSKSKGIEYDASGLEDAIEMVKKSYQGGWNMVLLNKVAEVLLGRSQVQQLSRDMETLATGFGEFAEKMALFEQYGEIDTSGLEKAIDAVQHAYKSSFTISIVNAIGYLTSGKSYVEQLCNDMDDLATSVKSFSEKLANFEGPSEADAEAFKAALAKAEEVLDGVDLSHVLSNVTTWLDADAKSTIGRFASDVRELSSAMNTFTINLRGFKPPAEEDVTAFKEAIGKAKTSIQSVMEDEDKGIGALWNSMRDWAKNASTADGQSYVAQFSSNITALSGALLQWNTDMAQFQENDFVVPDFSKLITAMNSMKGDGGLIGLIESVFTGNTNWDDFETNVGHLGRALRAFADQLGEDIDIEKLEAGITSASRIIRAVASLEGMLVGRQETVLGNLGKDLIGDQEHGIGGFGEALKTFVGQLGDLGDLTTASSNIDLLSSAVSKLADIKLTESPLVNKSAVEAFTENLNTLANSINGLTEPDSSIIDSFKSAMDSLSGIVIDTSAFIGDATKKNAEEAGAQLAASVGEGFGQAVESMSSALKAALASAAGSAQSGSTGKYQELGRALASAIADGITKGGITVVGAAKDVAERGGRAVKMARPGFYAAGAYLCEGLAAGIRENGGVVTAAAIAMAKECLSSMKGALQEQSPSKATYEMGDFLVVGMANGIKDNANKVRVESMNLGNQAVNSIMQTVKKFTSVRDSLAKGINDTSDDLKLRVISKVRSISDEAGGTANKGALLTVSKVVKSLKDKIGEAKTSDLKLSPEVDTNELESSAGSAEATVDEVKTKTDEGLEQALAKLRKVRNMLKSEITGSGEELNAGTKKAVSGAIDLSANESANKYSAIVSKMKEFVTNGVGEIGESTNDEALKKVNKTIEILKEELNKGTAKIGKSLKEDTKTAIADTGDIAETESTKTTKSMAEGIEKGSDKVTEASAKIAKDGASAASKQSDKFTTAGKNLADGLAQGIRSGSESVENAASKVADMAAKAVQTSLKIHSPSEVTDRFGRFFDLGFANGIWNNADTITRSTAHVGRLALESIQHTVDLISQVAHDEINITPTVRPVVDLSEVEREGSRISDYLNLSPTAAFKDHLGKITQISEARRNDTTNSDLLYALRELKDSVNTTPSNTYNINGITYDDGSNVAAAVGSLIRAARIERRA
jgi:tape measure domain-containing protein